MDYTLEAYGEWLRATHGQLTAKEYLYWFRKIQEEQGSLKKIDTEAYLNKHPNPVARAALVNWKEYTKQNDLFIPRLRKPRKFRLPDYYTQDQQEQLLSGVQERHRLLVWLLADTGCRIGEALNMKHSDLKTDEQRIKVIGKGDKERFIYPSPALLSALRSKPTTKDNPYLFPSPQKQGSPLTPGAVRWQLRRIQNEAHPHKFRHTYATTLLKKKAPLITISKLLGHASITTTSIYTHIDEGETAEEAKKAWRSQ